MDLNLTETLSLVIIFGSVFGMLIGIVGIVFYYAYRRNKLRHETIRMMIEKGVPIPPEFLITKAVESPFPAKLVNRRRNDFRTGLILMGLGLGLLIAIGTSGYIVLFIGLAFLIAGFAERKSEDKDKEQAGK